MVDDMQITRSLQAKATALINEGKTVKIDALKSQLNRASCRLQLPDLQTRTIAHADLYARMKPSILIVASLFKCEKCNNWHNGCASGFAIAADVMVTNYHVVNQTQDKTETLVVMTSDGKVLPVKEVLAASLADDVAILRIEGGELVPAPIHSSAPVGSRIRIVSHPDSCYYTLTEGIISRYYMSRTPNGAAPMMSVTADYAKGSSGGPVFDDQGTVVGLVSNTHSIYYNQVNGHAENLQMVVKSCVPAASFLKLIKPVGK
jgi:serine protease Do